LTIMEIISANLCCPLVLEIKDYLF